MEKLGILGEIGDNAGLFELFVKVIFFQITYYISSCVHLRLNTASFFFFIWGPIRNEGTRELSRKDSQNTCHEVQANPKVGESKSRPTPRSRPGQNC